VTVVAVVEDVAVVAVDGAVVVEAVGEVADVVEELEVAALVADDVGGVDAVVAVPPEVALEGAREVPDPPPVVAVAADVALAEAAVETVVTEEALAVVAVVFVVAVVSKRSQPAKTKHRSVIARMMLMSRKMIRDNLNGVKRAMISTSFPECRRLESCLVRRLKN